MLASKVAIVGAGVSGLLIARALLRHGYNVDIFEEDQELGKPEHCTGIVSWRTAKSIGKEAVDSIVARFRSLVMVDNLSSSKITLIPKEDIVKLDRPLLEKRLGETVEGLGGRIFFNSKIKILDNKILLNNKNKYYDIIFIAGGSRYARSADWYPRTAFGINVECLSKGKIFNLDGDSIMVRAESTIIDGFYSWIIPLEDSVLLGAEAYSGKSVNYIIDYYIKIFQLNRCIRRYGGVVLHGPPRPLPSPPLLYIGDAAGFTKPLTGGGLYPNSIFSSLFENNLIKQNNLIKAFILSYKKLYKKLKSQYYSVRQLQTGKTLGILIRAVHDSQLDSKLNEIIDYDEHNKLAGTVIRSSPIKTLKMVVTLMRLEPKLTLKLVFDNVVSKLW